MNNTKSLKIMIAFVIIFATLIIYLGFRNDQTAKEFNVLQNNMKFTLEQYEILQHDFAIAEETIKIQSEKYAALNDELNAVTNALEVANTTLNDLKSDEYELVYLGDYKITYYCDERYSHQCGGNGITASGTPTAVGVSAAADWSILPKGSTVYINGVGWREIQDVGGSVKGKHIDVLVETHDEAMDNGVDYEGVWLLVKIGS